LLASYRWPGNVRELENAIEWAISFGDSAYLRPEDLREEIRTCLDSEAAKSGEPGLYAREFDSFQKSLFERVIKECGGNRTEAARRLSFHPTWFRRRCRELGTQVSVERNL